MIKSLQGAVSSRDGHRQFKRSQTSDGDGVDAIWDIFVEQIRVVDDVIGQDVRLTPDYQNVVWGSV